MRAHETGVGVFQYRGAGVAVVVPAVRVSVSMCRTRCSASSLILGYKRLISAPLLTQFSLV
jgi:hypothetical protein